MNSEKSNLAINNRIFNFILGIPGNEPLLTDILDKKWNEVSIASLYVNEHQKEYFRKIENSLRKQLLNEREKTCLWFYFYGKPGCEKTEAAVSICSELSLPVINVNSLAILQSVKDPALISRLLIREGILSVSGFIFHNFDVLLSEEYRTQYLCQKLLKELSEIKLPAFFIGTERKRNNLISQFSSVYELEISLPDADGRLSIWNNAFADSNIDLNDDIAAQLSEQFTFSKEQVFSIVNSVSIMISDTYNDTDINEIIINECQKRQFTKLPEYSTKVSSIFSWDDLIIPKPQKDLLESICIYMEYRNKVFETWGFRNKIPYGQGVSVLFTGVSGTGKTMAAGILGKRLHRDVYKIDLSLVVSKYIGETEKNISAVFDEAESTGAILFFDEADALFGKRSSVRDAHDRYANIEVAYLLQRMEEYSGVTILATNFKQNMDDAFTRRIQFIIEFPLPDKEDRELLWRKVFPDEAPLHSDIDYNYLARKFNLSGANIRNISLDAAFRASDEKKDCIQMAHILKAIKQECKKTGTFVTDDSYLQNVN
jgi:SpoVK/Ycf46/Vps4 family AAA+-type ATPase